MAEYFTPSVVLLANALHGVGATKAQGLAIIAEIWRPFEPIPETTTQELSELNDCTFETLSGHKLVATDDLERLYEYESWMFPLWPLDLRLKKIAKAELRRYRDEYDVGGDLPHYGD